VTALVAVTALAAQVQARAAGVEAAVQVARPVALGIVVTAL